MTTPPTINYDPETSTLTVSLDHPPAEVRCGIEIERRDGQPRGYMYEIDPYEPSAEFRCLCRSGDCDGEPLPALQDAAISIVYTADIELEADQPRLAEWYEAQERRRAEL